MSERVKKKPRALAEVIRAATERALRRMEDEAARPQHSFKAGEINGWKADALASYVVPVVLRALRRRK